MCVVPVAVHVVLVASLLHASCVLLSSLHAQLAPAAVVVYAM